ncbi:alpha/beta hydrolase [Balneolales bacterium ANBcel1]|nr:alpha/beta hydrolase [Balneolales bacterium ANBcel1]
MTHKRRIVTGSALFWIIVIVAGGYAAVVLLMYLLQSAFIYFPTRSIVATPDIAGMEYEEVFLHTEDDVRIHGWYVPAERDRGTLLFFHGNAGNISGRIESVGQFHSLGLNVLIIDYRGYGKSEGRPTQDGTYRDAKAAWRYLTEVREESPGRIVLFGRSLGGGVAAWLASEADAGALALESTFTSAVDLASELYPFFPVRRLLHIRYPVKSLLPEVGMPVMIAHSPQDEVVPFAHGQALYETASEPKTWLELQGGHNDGFIQTGRAYLEGWDRFLDNALP